VPQIIAFHKPYGVLCQFSGEGETLAHFNLPRDVYPVGRLDKDSEGLLLLSDDGAFIDRVLSPSSGKEKTYWAQVEGVPSESALKDLRAGVLIDGKMTLPAKAKLLGDDVGLPARNPPIRVRKSIPAVWIELVLKEGRNRQVRRMTASVGHPTLRLVRVKIGKLLLGDLAPGQWRKIAKEDVL
jgi:23S rRNA pseudouridine2457 synthase